MRTMENKTMTLQEIANQMGTSPQRIHELEKRALRKIKEALLKKYNGLVTLEDFLPIVKELHHVD